MVSTNVATRELRTHGMTADKASLELWTFTSRIFQEHLQARIAKLDRDNTTAVAITSVQ